MKRPPMKKTVTSSVASICDRRSCVRERMSRNVQMMRLSQKITIKATKKPITIPSAFCKVVNKLLPDEPAPSTKIRCVMTGPTPLSEYVVQYYNVCHGYKGDNIGLVGSGSLFALMWKVGPDPPRERHPTRAPTRDAPTGGSP